MKWHPYPGFSRRHRAGAQHWPRGRKPGWVLWAQQQGGVGLALGLGLLTAALPATAPAQTHSTQAAALVEQTVRERAADTPGTLTLTLDTSGLERFAPCEALSASLPTNARLRHRMSVAVRCDTPERWQTYVQVQISLQGPYVVAARGIEQGQAISADLIEERQGDLLSLPRGVFFNAQDVLGQIASRRIGVGQVLRDNAVRSANSVQRGQMVRLRVRGPGFVATGEGEAQDSAAPGATVTVRTPSGQIVSGVLQADGVVEVGL